MKKLLLVLILTISFSSINADEWRKVTSASYGSLFKVFFLNDNIGWMVGSKGTIVKTINGGESWNSSLNKPLNITNSLYSISFLDANNGYFGGSKDLLLKTTDGGITVDTISFPTNDGTIRAIHFADVNTGWVLSTLTKSAKLYYTTDGGATWIVQITEGSSDLEDMHFYSSTKGICVGGNSNAQAIYSTTDGASWTKSPMPTFPISYSKLDLHGVYMLSETDAVIVGYGSSAIGLQPAILLKSTDGGANWVYMEQAEENRVHTNLYDVTFKDATNGLAMGGSATTGYTAYKTIDSGTNWQRINFPFGFTPKSIYTIGNKVWVAGTSSGSAYSTDFGNTWTLSTDIPSTTIFTFKFVTDKVAYAGGFGGMILKTEDKGNSWKAMYAPHNFISPTIKSISFINEDVGFVARKNRLVSKTTDGGNTWTGILSDTSWSKTTLYGIHFINENFGITVGKFGTGTSALYKTTDGGTTWDKQLGTFDEQLSSVHLFDENNGIVVGRSKVVSHTTDGGNTWTKATLNGLPDPNAAPDFNEVRFLNNNFGLAGGDILIKSLDAGKTWEYIDVPILQKAIESCEIADKLNWYIAGSRFVFKTTDGGANWIDISDTNIAKESSLSSITIDGNGYPWVGAGGSKIYTLSPITDIENNNPKIVNNFELKQNYPNPFNPTTTISYTIPLSRGVRGVLKNVTLKIYNILGKEIKTLVNEAKQPGSYKVTFDGSNVSSGVYYYTLNFNNNITARKMLLIK